MDISYIRQTKDRIITTAVNWVVDHPAYMSTVLAGTIYGWAGAGICLAGCAILNRLVPQNTDKEVLSKYQAIRCTLFNCRHCSE